MKAVRVKTVETRAKAARVLDLRVVERVVKPEKRKKDLVADLEGFDTNWAVPQVLRLLLHHPGHQRLEGRTLSHSESESLGGGERKETRKKYGSTISCIWGEAVHGMRILWRPYSQSYFWAEPPKIMLVQGVVSTT